MRISLCKKSSAVTAILVLLSASPLHNSAAQTSIHLNDVPRETIEARLRSFSRKDAEREQILKAAFQEVGCRDEHLTEQPVKRAKQPNLICVLPGATDSEIIIGAHFDHVSEGNGVVDNWSGAAMLVSFYQALSIEPRKHTFVFVAFSGEEGGLIGSEEYAKQLTPAAIARIRVMVNLDSLGMGPTKVWLTHSDHHLADVLYGISKSMSIPLAVMDGDDLGDEDSSSFIKRKIPTVMIHSVTRENFPILHSKRDDISAVNVADYFDSYRLVSAYLAYLDSTLS
jgi:Iap family predicted aminopeptidase